VLILRWCFGGDMNQRNTALSCQALTKTFGKGENAVHALRGVDLQVESGELMMLVGPSGCGKTTLISILAGILTPTSGQYQVLGQDLQKMSSRKRLDFRAKNIGFIFQQFNLLPSLTLAENVAIPCIINGMGRGKAIKIAKELLGELGLRGRENSLPSLLSGGQQQRVAIARALVHEPKILVCDEPTSALDHSTGQQIMQLLLDINRRIGTTMLIVSHDNRIFRYADRIAFMDDGHIDKIEIQERAI
jgi:putative ABC transport system ATP-binding protein